MKPVKFAVVGCGNVGTRHAAVVQGQDGAELVALCDTDAARLEKLGTLHEGVRVYTNLDELLVESDADVINVCTPHYLHKENTLKAISAGKHVLVEKPMALLGSDCQEMIRAADAAGILLMVVKQNRYNVPVALTREAIERGRLGRILMAQCNVIWNRWEGYYQQSPWLGRRSFEGGALFTQVSHFIDLLIWLVGEIVDAGGRIETKGHRIETEDCGTAWLRFANGAMGSLLWTTCAYHRNLEGSLTLIAERGTVRIGGPYLNKIEHWEVEGFPLPQGIEWVDKPNTYGRYQGSSSNHDKVIRDVVRRVRHEDFRIVSGEEARKTVDAIELVYARCSSDA